MHHGSSRRIRPSPWLTLVIITLILTGCFQAAGDAILPSPVGLTLVPTLPVESPTPFVTPISTDGFVAPTDDPVLIMTLTAQSVVPSVDQSTPTESAPGAEPTQTVEVFPPTETGSENLTSPSVETTEPASAPTTPGLLATPTALPSEGPCVHTVQPGEWLFAIARKYNVNPEDLKAANPQFAGRYDDLQPGDVLNIPNCNQPTATAVPPTVEPTTGSITSPDQPTPLPVVGTPTPAPTPIPLTGRIYTVAPGDTLGAIARKFGITVQALKEVNGLTDDALSVGQQLKIPKPQ
jgi:membrane-bound lytic murein transglycosylase D